MALWRQRWRARQAREYAPPGVERCLVGHSLGPAVRGATVAPALLDRFPPSDGPLPKVWHAKIYPSPEATAAKKAIYDGRQAQSLALKACQHTISLCLTKASRRPPSQLATTSAVGPGQTARAVRIPPWQRLTAHYNA